MKQQHEPGQLEKPMTLVTADAEALTPRAGVYGSRPIKRARRDRAEMEEIKRAIRTVVFKYAPMTVRQVFYQLTTLGVIEKTEEQYKRTVVRLLGDLRRDGTIPFQCIADSTRWVRAARTHSSLAAALADTARSYRRALWDQVPVYVEVWLEKEALAGVLVQETNAWDVPLFVTRGYPSLSFLHSAGEEIRGRKYPTVLYYFGDHDPSGVDIARNVEAGVREFAGDAEVIFERIAVTPGQIAAWNLPTRPTKKSDSRSKNFEGDSVEVDAIPPDHLRALCRASIEQHLPQEEVDRVLMVEDAERESLEQIAARFRMVGTEATLGNDDPEDDSGGDQ